MAELRFKVRLHIAPSKEEAARLRDVLPTIPPTDDERWPIVVVKDEWRFEQIISVPLYDNARPTGAEVVVHGFRFDERAIYRADRNATMMQFPDNPNVLFAFVVPRKIASERLVKLLLTHVSLAGTYRYTNLYGRPRRVGGKVEGIDVRDHRGCVLFREQEDALWFPFMLPPTTYGSFGGNGFVNLEKLFTDPQFSAYLRAFDCTGDTVPLDGCFMRQIPAHEIGNSKFLIEQKCVEIRSTSLDDFAGRTPLRCCLRWTNAWPMFAYRLDGEWDRKRRAFAYTSKELSGVLDPELVEFLERPDLHATMAWTRARESESQWTSLPDSVLVGRILPFLRKPARQ